MAAHTWSLFLALNPKKKKKKCMVSGAALFDTGCWIVLSKNSTMSCRKKAFQQLRRMLCLYTRPQYHLANRTIRSFFEELIYVTILLLSTLPFALKLATADLVVSFIYAWRCLWAKFSANFFSRWFIISLYTEVPFHSLIFSYRNPLILSCPSWSCWKISSKMAVSCHQWREVGGLIAL